MSPPLKQSILIYSGHCEIIGGDAKFLFDLLNSLNPHHFSISIATDINPLFKERVASCLNVSASISYLNTRPKLFKKKAFDTLFGWSKNLPLHRLLRFAWRIITFKTIRQNLWNAWIFYKLFKEKASQTDIFHFNNGGYPAKEAGLVAIMVARCFGIKKILMSFHNMPVPKLWFRPSDYLYDFFISRYCDQVIAASEILKEKLVKNRHFSANKVRVIYCGLEDKAPLLEEEIKSYREKMGIDIDSPVVIICGNFDEDRKGHLPLMEALAEVKQDFPKLILIVVGSGSPSRERLLKKKAASLFLEKNVRFLGYRSDIHELNSMADLAIIPSTTVEATPYTIKEAARAGKPVITTSVGGCREGIQPGISGIVVPPLDTQKMAEAIRHLLKNPSLRGLMGKAGRDLFLKRFLLKEKVIQYEEIYSQMESPIL